MLTITTYPVADIVITLFLGFFFYRGWKKGFTRTILGPSSIIAGAVIAYIYFLNTSKFMTALGICIISPFLINFITSSFLNMWQKAQKEEGKISFVSQFCGGLICLIWRGTIFILILLWISALPNRFRIIGDIQNAITTSHSYRFVQYALGEDTPITPYTAGKITRFLENPERMQKIQSSQEFKKLIAQEKFQKMINDPKTAKQIQEQNIKELMANPKIRAIIQDDELMKQFMSVNQRILKEYMEGEKTKE